MPSEQLIASFVTTRVVYDEPLWNEFERVGDKINEGFQDHCEQPGVCGGLLNTGTFA